MGTLVELDVLRRATLQDLSHANAGNSPDESGRRCRVTPRRAVGARRGAIFDLGTGMVRRPNVTARTRTFWILTLIVLAGTVGCMGRPPARAAAASTSEAREVREGLASFYGRQFHGKLAASGVRFDMNQLVAAHPTWPFGTVVRVTHLESGRAVRVKIVDRGPAAGPRREGVIIDLSRAAARALGFVEDGRARVRLEVLEWGADS